MSAHILLLPTLRRAAPQLSSRFPCCRSCLHSNARQTLRQKISTGAFRNQSYRPLSWSTKSTSQAPAVSPLGSLGRTLSRKRSDGTTSKKVYPEVSDKFVAYWLLGSAASVFGIVVFGGLTRLTESGLSITEWRPVTGSLPPLDASAWQSEFDKYRESPEFKVLNPNMELDEFKKIYWMEWTHRLWGRVIGLTFLVPSAYFIARRHVSTPMARRLRVIAALIGFQGALGWWMVQSGLHDDLLERGDQPRVSQYRLAAHLGTAFAVYVGMLWNGLSILRAHRLRAQLQSSADSKSVRALASTLHSPALRPLRISIFALGALVFTTALSGAIVAGLDAGLIYNEFPYMGLGLTPPRAELFDPAYVTRSRPRTPSGKQEGEEKEGQQLAPSSWELAWRNAGANPSLAQLDHRLLATTTFTAVMALAAWTRWGRRFRGATGTQASRAGGRSVSVLPAEVWRGVHGVVTLVWVQVTLGISTLLYMVPTPLAAAHQAGSLALLTGVVVLGSRMCVPRVVQRALKEAQGTHAMGLRSTPSVAQRARTQTMTWAEFGKGPS
ncbi:MAG: Cytochrome c oxidase assembly protein cox15 [Bathelium mastoideum]|nr:MAG: Cytochrome c oxidase assembly protein cox15 [Bathelium mastoideum]